MTALVFQSAASPTSGLQRENHFPITVQLCCLLADQGLESGIVSIQKRVLDSLSTLIRDLKRPLDSTLFWKLEKPESSFENGLELFSRRQFMYLLFSRLQFICFF